MRRAREETTSLTRWYGTRGFGHRSSYLRLKNPALVDASDFPKTSKVVIGVLDEDKDDGVLLELNKRQAIALATWLLQKVR